MKRYQAEAKELLLLERAKAFEREVEEKGFFFVYFSVGTLSLFLYMG